MDEYIVASAVIGGVVNAVQMQFPKIKGLIALALSVSLGAGLGYIHYFSLPNIETGILCALAYSGVYKLATKAGGK